MKAAITDGKGKVWVAEVPVPEPDAYQCLCRMSACASCTGTDLKHIHDKLPWRQTYPGILGHESVGRVVRRGDRVRYIREGEVFLRPTCVYPGGTFGGYSSLWGGFAEYGLVTDVQAWREDRPDAAPPAYARFQLRVPPELGITPADATQLITLKETASYVSSAGVRVGSAVVVLGSGSVGIAMCRFAKVLGADPVIVVGRRDAPLAYAVERIGADASVNLARESLAERVRDLTGGRGADLVIDTTGDGALLQASLAVLAPTGKLAPYATYAPGDTARAGLPADRLASSAATGEDTAHAYLLDAVRLGLVRLSDFYSDRLPLARIAEGFERLANKTSMKVVFEMEDAP